MSRLDRHVARVQNKLAIGLFLNALGAAVAVFAGLLLLGLAVDRLARVGLPRPWTWVWTGAGLTLLAAAAYAIVRRPTAHDAAIVIDQKLGLAEKFSTALYARHHGGPADPFAAAAVLDAERTADNVSVYRRFPLAFPTTAYCAGIAAVALLLALWLMPTLDLFGRESKRQAALRHAQEQAHNHDVVEQALAKVAALPKAVQNAPQVQLAQRDAHLALQQPTLDATQATDNAMKLLQEASRAGMDEVRQNQQFAQAVNNQQLLNTLNPSLDDKGPVADASRDIARGDFAHAMSNLQSLPDKFHDMAPAEQQKAAEQMQKMAAQLAKLSQDPSAMQHLQQQLQSLGANQQQAQQLAQQMQQAAQGNPQAQQQLQQMAKQMAQQMNGGKGPTPQQQQAIQQAMQQMQATANTQAKAQQMSAGAQQMAQAMQQMAQAAGQPKAGQQGQPKQGAGQQQQMANQQGAQQPGGQHPGGQQPGGQQQAKAGGQQPGGQRPGGQQQANGGQPGGQQPGGQQPGGNQPGGNQPGGQQPGGQQPGMAQGQQQMQDALAQMDAVQKDAEQMAAAQGAADSGAGNQPNPAGQPGPGAGQGANGGQPGGGKGKGMGRGPGPGGGGPAQMTVAQFAVRQEMDPSQQIATGRMLAKTYVKAPLDRGTSRIQLTPAAAAAVKDATDDVPEESVPKEAQSAVRGYFDTIGNDVAPAAPAPAPK